jgi:Proteasome-substrate-size regulator, mid region
LDIHTGEVFAVSGHLFPKAPSRGTTVRTIYILYLSENINLNYIAFISNKANSIFNKSSSDKLMNNKCRLGKEDRASFVKVLLKLVDRGQYSKNNSLAETVSAATSVLAFIEPSLVLPHITMKFQLALETVSVPVIVSFFLSF